MVWGAIGISIFQNTGPGRGNGITALQYINQVPQLHIVPGARCSSMVRAFTHGVLGRWIDPSWGGPIELFLVPASAP